MSDDRRPVLIPFLAETHGNVTGEQPSDALLQDLAIIPAQAVRERKIGNNGWRMTPKH